MAYYVKFPDQSNFGLEIQGISGGFNIKYQLAEGVPDMGPSTRYLLDARRTAGQTTETGNGGLWQQALSESVFGIGGIAVSNILINNNISTKEELFSANYEDVCSFDFGDGSDIPSNGAIMFGARATETAAFVGLAIYYLQITDDNGTHTFTFTATDNIIISDTGDLTLTMYNAPVDDSHLVYYNENFDINDYQGSDYGRAYPVFSAGSLLHCLLEKDWSPQGDYSVEFDVYFVGEALRIYGNNNTLDSRIFIGGTANIIWWAGSNSDSIGVSNALTLNAWSRVKLTRKSNQGTITVNGEDLSTDFVNTSPPIINSLNLHDTSNYTSGMWANLKLTDLDNPSNSLEFLMNKDKVEGTTEVIGALGDELVTNGDFNTDSDWTKGAGWTIENGKATCDGTQSGNSDIFQTDVVELGKNYLVEFTVSERVTGGISVLLGNIGGTSEKFFSNGFYSFVLTPDTNGTLKIRADFTFEGSVSSISVREAPEYQLINENNIELPTSGIGAELLTNGNFDTDTDWIYQSQGTGTASIANGKVTMEGVDFPNRGEVRQDIATGVGGLYLFKVNAEKTNGLNVVFRATTVQFRFIPSVGVHEFYFVAETSSVEVIIRSQGGESIVTSLSAKKIPNALLYNNFTNSDFKRYKYDSRYGLVGENLVVNSTFDTDSNWIKGTGWTIENGKAIANDVSIFTSLTQANTFIKTSQEYLFTMTIADTTANGFKFVIFDGDNGGSETFDTEGIHTWEYTAVRDNDNFGVRGAVSSATSGAIDNFLVQEVIPVNFEFSQSKGGFGLMQFLLMR